MTPEEVIKRREARIDALIDRVEGGASLTDEDWRQLDELNTLDLMSGGLGGVRELLDRETEADGAIELQ
jgi:hypothetical protein